MPKHVCLIVYFERTDIQLCHTYSTQVYDWEIKSRSFFFCTLKSLTSLFFNFFFIIDVCIAHDRLGGFRHNKVPPVVYPDSFPVQTSASVEIINQQFPYRGLSACPPHRSLQD